MYNYSVPLMLDNLVKYGADEVLNDLEKLGAKRVMLALSSYTNDEEKNRITLDNLKKYSDFFHSKGFETAVWTWTFMINEKNGYTKIRSVNGAVLDAEICPTDKDFTSYVCQYVKKLASTGVDMILFDDDYRLGYYFVVNVGCLCDNHLKMIRESLGENADIDTIRKNILSGGKNKYRSAFIKGNRDSMLCFAKSIRNAVDSVDPHVRVGVCSCLTSWDFDGADTFEVSKALAGNTKPFMRLIGAPYWVNSSAFYQSRLQDVIELERFEINCRSQRDGFEIISEGDTYPRPRYSVPASYLECFDTALRCDGSFDGILKYMFDYTSSPHYERKYVENSLKNIELYQKLEAIFTCKKCCGVRVFEAQRKFENMDIPADLSGSEDIVNNFFPIASRILSCNTIPTVYSSDDDALCGICCGESAKYLEDKDFGNGLILDITAAGILSDKNIDVGLESFGEKQSFSKEYFPEDNETVDVSPCTARNITVNKQADILSYFDHGTKNVPASYFYRNKDGRKFLVLNFDAYDNCDRFYRNYSREKQIKNNIFRLCGKRLPAIICGNPDLYIMVKASENKMAVGLWNMSCDAIDRPEICIDTAYKEIHTAGCEGSLCDGKVTLSSIHPFSFGFFEVSF